MGLDMYFFKGKGKVSNQKEMELLLKKQKHNDKQIKVEEVGYFRKHSDLHGFLEINRPISHKEKYPDFNCDPLYLSKEGLERIKEYSKLCIVNFKYSEHCPGFFWGQSCVDDWEDTIDVLDNILSNTDFENEFIFYDSWW